MRSKAWFITAVILIFTLLMSSIAIAAGTKASVYLNGKPLALQASDNPYLDGQIIYATPALIKALGATAAPKTIKVVDKQGQKATKYQLVVTKGQTIWTFTVGLDTCVKAIGKGKPALLNTGAKVRIAGDKVHAPLVFVAGQLGYTVFYDAKANVVNIAVKKVAKPPVKPQPKQSYINPDGTYNLPWEMVETKKLNPCLELDKPTSLGCLAIDSCGYYEIRYYATPNDFQIEIMYMGTEEAKRDILNVMKAFFPTAYNGAYAKALKAAEKLKETKGKGKCDDSGKFDNKGFRCWNKAGNLLVQVSRD